MSNDITDFVAEIKDFRKEIDKNIIIADAYLTQKLEGSELYEREMEKVKTHLQEAKMWAGKVLEVVGNPFPPELADKANVQ